MEEQIGREEGWVLLSVLARCFALSTGSVAGTVLAFSDAECGMRMVGMFVGLTSGSALFLWVAAVQIARHFSSQSATQGEQA